MKRINVMVDPAAKEVLVNWKNEQNHRTLDDAAETLLIRFMELLRVAEVAERKEEANHIDDLTED